MIKLSVNRMKAFFRRPFTKWDDSGERGLTLIEILIVIGLLSGLMVILARQVFTIADDAKDKQASLAMGSVSEGLTLYRVHNDKYPGDLDALLRDPGDGKRWRGPYIEEKKLLDPWGNPFRYQSQGRSFQLQSSGLDESFDTEDDIYYPEKTNQQP
jgi:general secretion pathway protein G